MNPHAIAHQAPLSMGFSRQEYWSELPFPSLEDVPNPGIEPRSPALQADSLPFEPQGSPSCFINSQSNVIDFHFFSFPLSTDSLIH